MWSKVYRTISFHSHHPAQHYPLAAWKEQLLPAQKAQLWWASVERVGLSNTWVTCTALANSRALAWPAASPCRSQYYLCYIRQYQLLLNTINLSCDGVPWSYGWVVVLLLEEMLGVNWSCWAMGLSFLLILQFVSVKQLFKMGFRSSSSINSCLL